MCLFPFLVALALLNREPTNFWFATSPKDFMPVTSRRELAPYYEVVQMVGEARRSLLGGDYISPTD